VNWVVIVFKNLYNKLWDLFASTKHGATKSNIEFNNVQVMDILLQNWFLINSAFMVLDLKEEDEGVTTSPSETSTLGGTKVPRVHSWCVPINLG
jgi:hypothetical protein